MHKVFAVVAFILAGTVFVPAQSVNPDEQRAITDVVRTFEKGLQQRDLKQIETTVAADLVVFENGHRNDGWQDFRDNHLIPELRETAPAMNTELKKVRVAERMAWAYSDSSFQITRKSGEKVRAQLYSIYVLERRNNEWKIVVLDWSMHVPR